MRQLFPFQMADEFPALRGWSYKNSQASLQRRRNKDYNPWAYSPQSWRILQVENVKEIVALNVRLARQAAGISQEELAERAGIDLSYGSRIERGKANPSVELLAKLGRALGVTAASLLTDRTGEHPKR